MPPGWLNEQRDLLEVLRWELEAIQEQVGEVAPVGARRLTASLGRSLKYCQRAEQLLGLLRGEGQKSCPVPMVKLLRTSLASLRERLEERLVLEEELPEDEIEVQGDEVQLECVVLGLLLDLFKETPTGEPWRHDLLVRAREEDDSLLIEFQILHSADVLCQRYLENRSEEDEPPEQRWYQHATILRRYRGFLEVDEAEGGKQIRIGLPVIKKPDVPASQRPTMKLPTSGYPERLSAQERTTRRPGDPSEGE